ncbi:unnamed protein product [Aphanomyces euteiches]|uniref:Uncharacterized protein n=1 Tax=Aphanomyces euteiches TaxID=100861 RepID=A0A6G0XTP7_9STRA|nr:hypothetical protein Ae201684_001462 [Aphanomyces euteiches]KAH9141330.1 hypothetical protein AeRB84_014531 [Aphanomyces euteiches]
MQQGGGGSDYDSLWTMAESLGLMVRTPSGFEPPSTMFDNKGDFADSVMQLAVKHRFQLWQKHTNMHLCYRCKSYPDCPFTIRGNVHKSGQIKVTSSDFRHNHPLGVQSLPAKSRNTMLCTKTLAQSLLVADVDYVNATAAQLQAHFKSAFGVDIGSSRIYTIRKLLESGTMGNDVQKFQKIAKALSFKPKMDSDHDEDDDSDEWRPTPTDAEVELENLRRQDQEHQWEMERRRLVMEEATNARLEEESRAKRRLAELEAETAEMHVRVTKAKARHDLLQTGMAREDVELLLA